MDILFAQIQADLRSNDALRQSGALLQALQKSASGRDISVIAKSAVEGIVAVPASAVCKNQCRLILQRLKYVSAHQENRWLGVGEARGDYPFSHHKLTIQFYEAAAAQDRKLEKLVHKAILELWRPDPGDFTLLLTKGIKATSIKVPPTAYTLTGSSEPVILVMLKRIIWQTLAMEESHCI